MTEGWIWEKTSNGTGRFILGAEGENPLLCFGINPSTAIPGDLDPTVTPVSKHAHRNGHDSWTMLNVYPQISTDPKGMPVALDPELKQLSEKHIAEYVAGRPLTILAAWGTLIESRPYLRPLIQNIAALPELQNCRWVTLGDTTKAGHPRHPLYVKGDTPLVPFHITSYTSNQNSAVSPLISVSRDTTPT